MEETNGNGIDYNDIKAAAKALGINIVGKKKAVAILLVFDGIVADYGKAKQEFSKEDFESYKTKNKDMLAWYNEHRDWKPPAEGKPVAVARDDQHTADNLPEETPAEESVENDKSAEEYLDDSEKDESKGESVAADEKGRSGSDSVEDDAKTVDDSVAKKKGKAKAKKKDLAKTKDRIKKAKAEAEKKAEKKAKKASSVEKDEYGFVVGTKRSLFCKEIAKKPCTMFEIKKMDWNDRMAGFYDLFSELQEKGLAGRDAEGRMSMKKK